MTAPTLPRTLAPCGTLAAYKRHLRRSQQPCRACLDANAKFHRERRGLAATGPVRAWGSTPLPDPPAFTRRESDAEIPVRVHEWCGQVDDPARGEPCPCRAWERALEGSRRR